MYSFWVDMLAARMVRCRMAGFQGKDLHKLEVVEVVQTASPNYADKDCRDELGDEISRMKRVS